MVVMDYRGVCDGLVMKAFFQVIDFNSGVMDVMTVMDFERFQNSGNVTDTKKPDRFRLLVSGFYAALLPASL